MLIGASKTKVTFVTKNCPGDNTSGAPAYTVARSIFERKKIYSASQRSYGT